jgi:methionyl-tRNA formyltransferase
MNESLSYAFFGTGPFAASCLELLWQWKAPSWVVTSPPRASGRGKKNIPSPVGGVVAGIGSVEVPLVESGAASSDDAVAELKSRIPVDFSFVVDFGQLITEPLLGEREKMGCLNIHPSSLPRYRGAAPIQRALMNGEETIGVTVFKLARRMDSGPVLLRGSVPVLPDDDFGTLRAKAAEAGANAFIEFVAAHPAQSWEFEPQNEAAATNAPKISPDEERLDWSRSARDIARQVRALSPKPGAWTTLRGRRLLILSAREAQKPSGRDRPSPGSLRIEGGRPLAGTGEGFVELMAVQAEGGKPQPASSWKNGLRIDSEECLI